MNQDPAKPKKVKRKAKGNHSVAVSSHCLLTAAVFLSSVSWLPGGINWMRFPYRSGVRPAKHPSIYPMYAPVIIVMGYACHGRSLGRHDFIEERVLAFPSVLKEIPEKKE
jgi:hypothetical protein